MKDEGRRLLSIGEFAARTRIAPSALRYYDDADVLRPAHVDADSGYRRYAPSQVPAAVLLRELRALAMPIAEIRELLASRSPGAHRLLDEHWRGVEAGLAEARVRLASAHRLIDRLGDAMSTVVTVDAAVLSSAIRQVLPAAPVAPHRLPAGVLFDVSGTFLRLVATDGHRLALRDLVPDAIDGGDASRIVPGPALIELAALLEQTGRAPYELRFDQLPELPGPFPAYHAVLEGPPRVHRLVAAAAALRRQVAEAGPIVRLTEFEPAVLVALDREYLTAALAAAVGPDLILETSGPLGPVLVRSADDGSFTGLVMPIRLQEHGRG